jgi:hypothetical protein
MKDQHEVVRKHEDWQRIIVKLGGLRVKKKGEDLKGLYSAEPEENHGRI